MKRVSLILLCLLAVAAAWFFWPRGGAPAAKKSGVTAPPLAAVAPGTTNNLAAGKTGKSSAASKNRFAFRLTNTKKSLKELIHDQHAILLQNAFIDTAAGLAGLKIPDNLKSKGDPGAYIVQARGPISAAFRAALQAAGGQIVSYIPNNAYLVQISASGAGLLSANALVQSVLPYEPYYKLPPSLLALAAQDEPVSAGTPFTVETFNTDLNNATQQLATAGFMVIRTTPSSLGPPLLTVVPKEETQLASLAVVPILKYAEPAYLRQPANDLARVTLGISTDTVTSTNWLGLSGANVTVEVNDSGIDAQHPDFSLTGTAENGPSGASRVNGDSPLSLTDTNGHGTHVAGIIAGNGSESYTVTDTPQGSVTNADFRGKAPAANLYSVDAFYSPLVSDQSLQQAPALTNALISNNSWVYGGDNEYDLAAASYDAATRDALPTVGGSQPVLFVFAAGDDGGGATDGSGGSADSIESPGTAKDVITVGGLEQLRDITNLVTEVTDGQTNQSAIWQPETDSSSQVGDYSARGNVGVDTEGTYGRFKPDVVAPGSWVVSTSSGFNDEWNTNAYYNPTNITTVVYTDQTATTNGLYYPPFVSVPPNAVGVTITISSNEFSTVPFPTNLIIYAQISGYPDPVNTPAAIDITTSNNMLAIPPTTGGNIKGIQSLQNGGFDFAVADSTSVPVNFDVTVSIATTNNQGNAEQVLEGLNNGLAPYYRFETGTSMAAPAVSGVLALLQDYFTNTLHETPSPALLKAMLINGSRSIGDYNYSLTNDVNSEGWGLPDIQNSLPFSSLTEANPTTGNNSPLFFVDQSPTNGLATGARHTYTVNINTNSSSFAQYLPLQATLVWTDPPGDPSAAIKLVNGLNLIITNLDTGEVFYGNDISPDLGYNLPWSTNGPPNIDTINNVQNILLSPAFETLAGSYSVTVVGRDVNVNAVTEQTNNVVQDYALVVAVGEGEVSNAISSVTDDGIAANLTSDQDITYVATTNQALLNQFVGANTPFQGTNMVPLGTNTEWGSTGVLTVGMTNQWHFYVVTNNALDPEGKSSDVTNAAFITFDAYDLSIPRMGVFQEGDPANATRPEADIDLYATTDSGLTNLNPLTISNCLAGVNNSGVSLSQGGTEFVYFTNSHPGQVYYIGVMSEDQMASEYDFLPVFTATPFSQLLPNGDEQVNGLLLPAYIPDGSPSRPGITNVFALAIYPMQIENVVVTNLNQHQNFGDLIGTLSFGGSTVVLNNHDGLGDTYNTIIPKVYDDSAHPLAGSTNSDGPGKLTVFQTKSALGPWMLSEVDDSLGFTGQVSQFSLLITPHRDIKQPGITVTIPPGGWFVDYVTVPPGYTNLTFYATNLPPVITPPLQMYEKFNAEPTLTDYDFEAWLTNDNAAGTDPGNSISIGPPLDIGNYFVGIYNPNTSQSATVFISAALGIDTSSRDLYTYTSSGGPQGILNDGVTTSQGIFVSATQLVESVNVGFVVNSPQIADMTFTLVSPTGQRILLMENRGGSTTNGAGGVFLYTNVLSSQALGGAAASTNYLTVSSTGGAIPITYNFYTAPDQMTVYDGTNPATFNLGSPDLLLNTGLTNNPGNVPQTITVNSQPGFTNITIIMNQFGNPALTGGGGDEWIYTAGAPETNFEYLTFTDDTNLADVPIKYAVPPFDFPVVSSNYVLSDFDLATNGLYRAPTNIPDAYGGWTLPTNVVTYTTVLNVTNGLFQVATNVVNLTNNYVSVVTDPANAVGDGSSSNFLALAKGTVTRLIPTIPGDQYNVTFWYRGPGIASWWRGEGNASDSSDAENNGNNGRLVGLFNFPAGEVGQAFQFENFGNEFMFAGTNAYVQIPQSASLDVGKGSGFTVEGWINPTNLARPQPVLEWLAHVSTNAAITNLVIKAGPYLNPATGHYYYLLGATDWLTSEQWAISLGGHLATINTANEQNWVFDNFAGLNGFNHNLWLGLTNNLGPIYSWSSGLTNFTYTNWLSGQPDTTCGTAQYTGMLGATNAQPGLWVLADDNGFICNSTATNKFYGVAEVDQIQTNGVQFWISATNTPGTTNLAFANTNGCLYADIVDTNFVAHEIYSPPGLLESNVFQHVALTYDTNNGLAILYLNGTNVASTNLGVFVPKTDGDVLLGRDMSPYTNNYYGGLMDEMSVYGRALSAAEIAAIYQASAFTTNRTIGKFDPAVTPAYGLAEAEVMFGSTSNVIFGVNDQWQLDSYTFTATSNSMPLQITGLEPGMLLDDFEVTQAPVTNLYYLPEQSLDALTGDSAYGDWTLQVWDNLTGTAVTNLSQLLSWQLSFILQSNATFAASLSPESPNTSTIPAGQTVYYQVNVPAWANEATNILVSSTLPVNVFFNPTNLPTGVNPGDITLLTASTGGPSLPIAVNTNAPYMPYQAGTTYYLGVQNPSATTPATVVLQVDFDITPLTNGVPDTSAFNTNDTERYFSYTVGSNAYEATFQLLKLSGNADLVVSKGSPLPTLTNTDYGSFNDGRVDENIYVLTNSSPVPLSPGTWYIGVIKRDSGVVDYTVLAQELDVTNSLTNSVTIINLTNGVPFNWSAGPGAALTNFFVFAVTNPVVGGSNAYVPGLHFELYNLTGNGDLTVQTNALPLAPPFFQTSQNPGRNPESILVYTNSGLTNLAANWYLGVPNNEISNINYTIVAWTETNSYFPAFPGASGMGGGAVGAGHAAMNSTVYHVTSTNDSGPGTLRDAVNATNRTVVFDLSGTISLLSPLVITNSYLTIAGQTAPGGGVTVAGSVTTVTNAHDVIIRDVRFRPVTDPTVVWQNGFEGYPTTIGDMTPPAYVDGWQIDSGSIDLYNATQSGYNAYQGSEWVDLNGDGPGEISTNIPTVSGQQYVLNFAYAPNPESIQLFDVLPEAAIFINNTYLNTINAGSSAAEPPISWRIASYTFKATSASTLLTFDSTNTPGPCGVFLDDVTLSTNAPSADALQFQNAYDVIADHVSTEWSPDHLVSVLTSSNITVQWSILADSVYETNDSEGYGSLLRYGAGYLSFNHDLYADNYNGNPRLGDNLSLDFVNNVIYNWGLNSGFSTNDLASNPGGFTNYLNYVCNYLIAGTNSFTNNIAFAGGATNTWIFQTNNFIDSNTNGILDGANTQWAMFTNQFTKFGQGFPLVAVPTDEAYLAYEKVLDFAGVNLDKRDPVDTNVVYKVRTQTGTLINSAGALPVYNSTLPYLDTDQDGIPDFWEITFGEPPYVPSNNDASQNALGYTTLEEYNNWLAGPHAVTVTNTPVGVDLQQMFGATGHLSFFVTNGIHGIVYLTNVLNSVTNTGIYSNSIAVFTPTNNAATNYSGYASFDVYVTNTDTVAYFGPVTVSVVVSALSIATNYNFPPIIHPLVAFIDPTNTGGSDFYEFTVTNYDGSSPASVLFTVTNASGPVILVANYGLPLPSLSSYDYISTNSWTTSESILINSTSAPVALTNGNWYLAVVNVAGSNVTYNIDVTQTFTNPLPLFLYPTNTDVFTNIPTFPFSLTCLATDLDIPALPLTFSLVSGPTNMTVSSSGLLDWTATLAQGPTINGPVTNTILVSVSNTRYVVTNSFTIITMGTNLPPVFISPNPPNQVVVVPGGTLTFTNAAINPNQPDFPLTYSLLNAPLGASIDPASGVITWTPADALAGYNFPFTTVVTDTDPWALNATSLSATNTFEAYVEPGIVVGPPQTNTVPPNGINWLAISVPTNAVAATNILLFATNLPVNVWFSPDVPPNITNPNDFELLVNSSHGVSVLTTNSTPALVPGSVYFLGVQNTNAVAVGYALQVNFLLVSATNPVSITVPISSIVHTNIGGTNGYLLTWFAPSNDLFQVQWSAGLVPPAWNSFTNIVGYNTNAFTNPSHTQFNFFDDGSQTGGFGAQRFYRLILLNSPATNNTVAPGGINWLAVSVPTNALAATNTLLFATNLPVNVWFSTNLPPTTTSPNDVDLLPNATNGTRVLSLDSTPALVPGGVYFLGVQNTNAVAVGYALQVNFLLVSATNPVSITVPISSIVHTNIGGTNGYLLTWFAPSNDLFQVQWTDGLVPPTWNSFTNIVGYNTNAFTNPSHTQFNFFDDGSQTGGFGAQRFYRLILLSSPASGSTVAPGGINWLTVSVPTNALAATNTLLFATNLPVNVWFSTNLPPTTTNPNDVDLLPNATNGTRVLSLESTPALVPGGVYFLGVQNTNAVAVGYALQVNFLLVSATNPVSITVPISSIVHTNIGGTNGYLLTWFAPSNDLFQVQWTDGLVPPTWNSFTNIVGYNTNAFTNPSHTQFNFFDDGSQTGGFGAQRFYRLILLNGPASTSGLTLPAQSNLLTGVSAPLVVTNTATDSNPNAVLTYSLVSPPAGAAISTNGIITWTPSASATNSPATFTTIVTDNGTPSLSATNRFTVTVVPVPDFSDEAFTTNGYLLTWFAPSNELFQVEWRTNLLSGGWNTFTNIIGYNASVFTSPAHTQFNFLDNGSQDGGLAIPHYYHLVLLTIPLVSVAPPPTIPTITSVVVTPSGASLKWSASTNEQFEVRWATNLISPIAWTTFPNVISSTSGAFVFTDTNAPLFMKFYELILLP